MNNVAFVKDEENKSFYIKLRGFEYSVKPDENELIISSPTDIHY